MRSDVLPYKVWNNFDFQTKVLLFIGWKIQFAENLSKVLCHKKAVMQVVSRKVFYVDLARALYL
jgi:hypothetical protein